jgi:hypothetical protein
VRDLGRQVDIDWRYYNTSRERQYRSHYRSTAHETDHGPMPENNATALPMRRIDARQRV